MNNNIYISSGGISYQLIGLVNSEVDGAVVHYVGQATIYDIITEKEHRISLSQRYCLFVKESGEFIKRNADSLKVGDEILISHYLDKVTDIKIREGKDINFRKITFNMNDFLVFNQI